MSPERVCDLCGRVGTRSFVRRGRLLVCSNDGQCALRVARADAAPRIYTPREPRRVPVRTQQERARAWAAPLKAAEWTPVLRPPA